MIHIFIWLYIQILKGIYQLFKGIGWLLGRFFYYLFWPFSWLNKHLIFPKIIMPIYKIYLNLNNIYQNLAKAFSQWIFAPLTTRYTIHAIMVLIGCAIFANNLYARENNQNFIPVENKNGILINLITPENQEYIEETINYEQLANQNQFNNEETDYLSSADHAITISVDYLNTIDAITFAKPDIVNTATNLKLRNQIETYTVESGDTISGIAEKFGLKMATLLNTNGLTVRSSLKPGQTLTILPIDGLVHTVKSGDTISKLSKTYQAQTQQIKEYNNLSEDTLAVGEKLIIPYGVKPTPVVVSRPTVASSGSSGTPTTNQAYDGSVAPGGVAATGTKLQWPSAVYVITQYYHMGHLGLDISGSNALGTALYAADDGVVTVAQGGWNGGYGVYVKIDHGNGIVTLYGHCSKLYVQAGETVTRGQTIALMGSTGRSTGPHIHFEVIVNGAKVNPLNYIR